MHGQHGDTPVSNTYYISGILHFMIFSSDFGHMTISAPCAVIPQTTSGLIQFLEMLHRLTEPLTGSGKNFRSRFYCQSVTIHNITKQQYGITVDWWLEPCYYFYYTWVITGKIIKIPSINGKY